ncbi:helix-turn-helix transcriptional regulator [Hyphococcus sp.]|jgi:AraC-like DNA-binding protein|uniref:helix-turn-helix transcriptional regulator n=1 Tax=Hyphococcus sp. TaxID=2038636 RepID=UPI003D11B04D
MQLLTTPPEDADALHAIYARTPREGMFFSGLMHRERFDIAGAWNEDWSCAAIAWQTGGAEEYALQGARAPLKLLSAGAVTLARGARYAYAALGETPFRSNMISFPHWITESAAKTALEDSGEHGRRLETRLIRPDAKLQALMDDIAQRTRAASASDHWHAEKCALLYAGLLDTQDARAAARDDITAVKASTRAELARRCGLAKEAMLQRYNEPELSLGDIAREARLSQYHLIRVFKTVTGATPMQFLSLVRMDAALRLLKETKRTTGDIAAAVGYSDRTAFFRAFRKTYGCAPSAAGRNK